ncbi:MAG: molybdenum cofactor guanylyltransferase [Bacteroidetes bacterium]|nr:molybdenum cofactor guanylyltransferase [Bacteroidota bacterium]
MKKANITGVILAGGKNSRMGSEKGLLEVEGKRIIEHIIDELKQVVDEIIVISNNTSYNYLNYKVYSDTIKDCGPMGGIHAALAHSTTEKNLIISCDMPFISKKVLTKIISSSAGCEVAIPEHDDWLEPLCAVYSKSCAATFEKLIAKKKFKLTDSFKYFIVKKINFTQKELSGDEFLNVNTPKEYQNIKT